MELLTCMKFSVLSCFYSFAMFIMPCVETSWHHKLLSEFDAFPETNLSTEKEISSVLESQKI